MNASAPGNYLFKCTKTAGFIVLNCSYTQPIYFWSVFEKAVANVLIGVESLDYLLISCTSSTKLRYIGQKLRQTEHIFLLVIDVKQVNQTEAISILYWNV